MKANAPEKIYIDVSLDLAWGMTERSYDNEIEYTRTDVFIEKACTWLKNHYRDYMHNPTGEKLEAFFGGDMCNDFEDYMESKV